MQGALHCLAIPHQVIKMSTKLFALVFILGLCIVTQGSSPDVEERISLDQLLTDAEQDVAKLKAFIDSVSAGVSRGAAGVIKGGYAAFDRAAAQRLQHAGSLGSAVSRCVDSLKSRVNSNADLLARNVVQCVTSDVDSALNDIETLLGVAQSAERDIGSARAALKACGHIKNVFKKVKCVAKETATVTKQAASLAWKVTGAIRDAVVIYNTFPTSVCTCEKNQLAVAEADAQALAFQVSKC